MAVNKGLFTSNTDMWATPQDFYDGLNKEFGFNLDVCATSDNAKCESYFTKEDDGLQQDWKGTVWMNPPYGRVIGAWVKKAYESSLIEGTTVVCLLPARTDTKWWHEYCMKGEVRLVKGRLKFGDSKNAAPFPSAVIVFGEKAKRNKLIAM
ncbi:phage N-6-adenine-methyltransferase [Paenibacillus alvei]|uniref:DNA N-6-adenine-methyltransferase n=1 Tax=Paenibacillus alvei TaxID=44250 RepID=UPI00227ED28C|nr:DNA N-6-adenine-methyltransferase [Paenibacillus alvei]MCY9737425.1 phage N-6-adenine-methyltransferase [Paenibacillus alvei]